MESNNDSSTSAVDDTLKTSDINPFIIDDPIT